MSADGLGKRLTPSPQSADLCPHTWSGCRCLAECRFGLNHLFLFFLRPPFLSNPPLYQRRDLPGGRLRLYEFFFAWLSLRRWLGHTHHAGGHVVRLALVFVARRADPQLGLKGGSPAAQRAVVADGPMKLRQRMKP